MDDLPVGLADIEDAAARLAPVAVRTPLVRSPRLDAALGATVLVKAEPLQRTGSFKFRGAYNAVVRAGGRPVVAYSSGNHAQGVAAAARLAGVPATIVMPRDAPAIKIAGTRADGAEVVLYDRTRESREAIGEAVAERAGAALIKPYDATATVAGQGTCGLEMVEQSREHGLVPDLAVMCCGGGGLAAGCAVALAAAHPGIALYTAEPAGFDDTKRSLAAGERLGVEPGATSVCDALLAPMPGAFTFEINRRLVAGGLAVSDAEVAHAMRVAFEEFKLVVEPGGAVALAAVLAGKVDVRGRTVLVVLSGGNVDLADFHRLTAAAPALAPAA
ncbi:MAG: pyridoxal-phosphate dependent enzyme [Alphaproteobacteria bacterium]|jgi:threonine dehydratase|nr:pyridoxal-phosphate dependent enzyme [Alphaproteobacteria bacterium]